MNETSGNQPPRPHSIHASGAAVVRAVREAIRKSVPVWRAAWHRVALRLRALGLIALAVLIVLEEWGWQPLADLLGRIARWRPLARLESAIARLPPYAALVVFVLPSTLLLPLKFLALFLVTRGHFLLAAVLFAAAKVVATALIARLFILTQPALMQIGWFAWGYDTLVPWKDALVEVVRASSVWRTGRLLKERARRTALAAWRPWRPTVLELRAKARAGAAALAARIRRWLSGMRAPER